ncbi:MAG TPA: hypothetical protein PLO41_04270, partial [Rubrivivax sp.]|nr:hypothetical protein [Rubrivivax sp.]
WRSAAFAAARRDAGAAPARAVAPRGDTPLWRQRSAAAPLQRIAGGDEQPLRALRAENAAHMKGRE